MRKWGANSKRHYDTLDPRLQRIMDRVLHEVADISITCGFRGEADQNRLFDERKSRVRFPQSKHNNYPSVAVDFQPWPYPEREEKLWAALAYVAGRAVEIGIEEGIALRWGGDWNCNGDLTDQHFDDLFHLEIVESPPSEIYPRSFDISDGSA